MSLPTYEEAIGESDDHVVEADPDNQIFWYQAADPYGNIKVLDRDWGGGTVIDWPMDEPRIRHIHPEDITLRDLADYFKENR